MASYEAQINIIANGLSKIEKIISKVSQLESIVNSINKKPIDINASSAEKSVESFWQQTKILDANIDSIKKTSDSASKSFEAYSAKLAAANKILESTNPNTKKYTKALEDQKKAQDGLSQSMYEMGKAELDLAKAQQKREEAGRGLKEAERAKEAAAAIRQLADDYLLLGASQQRSIRDGRILKDQSAVTVSQLTAQGNALMLIANNSKIASSEFNRFSIAAQLASQKSYEAQQKRLGALAFGLSAQAPRVNIGRGGEGSISAARSQVTDLINSYSSIVKSEAAMSAFVARASELQSIVPAISNEFSALEEIIGRAKNDLSAIGMRGQSARIATAKGPATNLGSVSAFTQKATYERKVSDELSRQAALEDRINQGLLTQVQKTQLLGRLHQGFDALSQNRLEDAQRITREIDKQRFSLERLNRSTGPIKTGQFSPINGQKQLNAIYSANEMLLAKLNGLEAQGLNVSSEKITLQNQINRIQSGTFDINLKNLDIENNTLAAITRSIALLRQRNSTLKQQTTGYPSSPIMGGVNMPGSPIFNQTPFLERRFGKRGGAAISEGLIGGAFPLLFGQGLASSVGGGLGGALGGFAGGGLGFGLSLIGTALGSAIDGLATAAKDAASAMRDPITNFQKLADAGLFASKSQELQIKNLIEYGNSTKAAAVIQEELAKKIGVLAMRDMANLDEQSVRLGKAWAELNLQIQAAIAGPLAGLLEWVTSVVELFSSGNRREVQRKDFIQSLTPAGKIEYNRRKALNLYGATGESEAALQQSLRGMTVPLAAPALKVDPAKQQEEQDKNRQEQRDRDDKQLQRAREVEDYIRNSKTQTRQLEYQRIDLERQSWDLYRRINDDIFNKQQQVQRDQITVDRLKQQIAIDTVDLQYRKQISNEEGRAAAVLSAEADLAKLRQTNAAEIEAARRGLELDIAKQQRETQNYIYGLAREADSIRRATLNYENQVEEYKLSNARKIADINKQALRDQEDAQIKANRGSPVYGGLINRSGTPYTGGNTVSGFSISSYPGMRNGKMHAGVDVAMPIGTALGYSLAGIVKSTASLSGYGKTLEVELENGVTAFAAHLNEVLVKVGDKFTANQILAKTGNTGRSTGPHAHFEGARGGDPYAPLPYVVLGSGVSAAAAAKPKPKPKPTPKPTLQPASKQFPNDGWPGWGSTKDFVPPSPRPSLLMPGASRQTDPMNGGVSSSNIGNQFLSMLGNRNGFEDTAGPGAARKPWVGSAGQFANKGQFQNGLDAINKAGASVTGFLSGKPNDLKLFSEFYKKNLEAANQYDLAVNLFIRYISGIGAKGLKVSQDQGKQILEEVNYVNNNPDAKKLGWYEKYLPKDYASSYKKKIADGMIPVTGRPFASEEIGNSLGRFWAEPQKDGSYLIKEKYDFPYAPKKQGGNDKIAKQVNFAVNIPDLDPANNARRLVTSGHGIPFSYQLLVHPDGRTEVLPIDHKSKSSKLLDRSALPGNFDTSKLQRIIGSTATIGSLEGLIAGNPAPAADILPPKIEPVPPSSVRGQMQAIDAQDAKVKQEIIDLQVKANQLGEEGAYQRLIDLATGDKTVKQKQRELRLVEAEAKSIGMMSSDKQEFATFDARAIESLIQIQEENDTILRNTRFQGKEKEKLAEANEAYLKNAMDTLAVERLILSVQQEQRFNGEKIAAQMQLQIRGAGANAGFYGAAAQAYNQEIAKSGNVQQATDLAKLAKANELNDQIVSMRENLLMLQDPTYQVVESAKAIGSAFSDSFKGVVSGSTTAQQALANFFQRTSDHFLEMAAQMLTQQLVLKLIGFGMNLLAPGSSAIGGSTFSGAFGGAPSVGFSSAAGMNLGFAKGGVFTNSIVSSPTLFKFASGGALSNGVMGEAGPEAIMPLTRGPGGRLGVDASGSGGGVNVTVNVDAKGSSVQGDDQRSGELGRAIATAVQQELIKQKRSGGILSK